MDIVDFTAGWCREGFSGRNMWGFHYAIHYSDLNLWGIESAQKGAYHKLHGVDALEGTPSVRITKYKMRITDGVLCMWRM